MLINVIPISNVTESAIVFSISFDDLEPHIDQPFSWISQMQSLKRDGLEVPEFIHALDKSACLVSLLADITFDLSTMVVSCQFVDGMCEQWPLEGEIFLNALQKILREVNNSSLAPEIAKRSEKTVSGLTIVKKSRHKKQRSLLMTLVASIIPLSSSSSSKLLSPPPSPTSPNFPDSPLSPRACRRRARSELVDVFRRFAVSELSHRFPRGGYYPWILNSMLRRVTEAVDTVLKTNDDSASRLPHPFTHVYPDDSEYFSITAASLPPTPSVSDDEGDSDTDSSSLHTPTSSHFNLPCGPPPPLFSCTASPSPPAPNATSRFLRRHHRNHSVTSIPLPVVDVQAGYSGLSQIQHLRQLLALEIERQEQIDEELNHHYNVLEVNSRRRAYLNKDLRCAVMSKRFELALALPNARSPLGMHCWTSDQYEYAPDELNQSDKLTVFPSVIDFNDYDRSEFAIKRTKTWRKRSFTPFGATAVPRLFPVRECEEESDIPYSVEDEKNVAESEVCILENSEKIEFSLDSFEIDLDSGLKCSILVSNSEKEIDNEKYGIIPALQEHVEATPYLDSQRSRRSRTSSMYAHAYTPRPTAEPLVPCRRQRRRSFPPPLRVTTVPIISSVNLEEEMERPPVYTEVDINPIVPSFNEEPMPHRRRSPREAKFVEHSEEFTLAMDLPLSVRVQDEDIFSAMDIGPDSEIRQVLDVWGEM